LKVKLAVVSLREMAGIEVKSFAQPDEFQEHPRFVKEVLVGGVHVARTILKPGWSWT
jgi:hypothetical protein